VRRAICSPGGMTAAGVAVLEERGLRASVDAAVQAAVARARELA
jgi:pyrroline-5-carboxylate reductase